MNFNSCISASILSHVLILGLLYFASPFKDMPPTIYRIDIVPPVEDVLKPAPPLPAPSVKEKPPLLTRKPKLPEKEIPPKTLDGTGTALQPDRDSKREEPAASPESAVQKRDERESVDVPAGKSRDLPAKGDGSITIPRDSLFDRGTIEKFAKKETPVQKGLTFDTSGFKHRGYMRMLKERIEDIWKYPKEMARQGISGDLYLKFAIQRDGKLGSVELIRTSGYRELDEAAMRAVKKAGPFWPLPEDMENDFLEIKGHFIYVFGNTLIL